MSGRLQQLIAALNNASCGDLVQCEVAELQAPPDQLLLGVGRILGLLRQDLAHVAVDEVCKGVTLCLRRLEVPAFAYGDLGRLGPALGVSEAIEGRRLRRLALEADFDAIGAGAVVGDARFDVGHERCPFQ